MSTLDVLPNRLDLFCGATVSLVTGTTESRPGKLKK